MSESDQFRQYAEEAMLWVSRSKNEEEKQILVELLCTWTAAAVLASAAISQSPVRDFDCCPRHLVISSRSSPCLSL